MKVYRISPCKFNSDLSGYGASISGGRWNSKGVFLLYTSNSSSTAMLEVVVHLSVIPIIDYYIAVLSIPEDTILEIKESDLPPDWLQYPSSDTLKKIGDDFVASNKFLALKVPSAVLSIEYNYLINPLHYDFSKVELISSERIAIDERLLSGIS
jgi:RES domain-containing protein